MGAHSPPKPKRRTLWEFAEKSESVKGKGKREKGKGKGRREREKEPAFYSTRV
jgi:hypothetical protein